MSPLSSTYLLPAVLLNPILILHGFNTFCSHFLSTAIPVSPSNHRWLEKLGPAAVPGFYFDVHNNQQLCLGYTALMVVAQILAYGKVNDTRIRRKSARAAAKAERDQLTVLKNQKAGSEVATAATTAAQIGKCDSGRDIPLLSNARSGTDALGQNVFAQQYKKDGQRKGNVQDSATDSSSDDYEETMA